MAEATHITKPDGDFDEWEIPADRYYTLTSTTFTKRQLRQQERYTNCKGELITVPWSRELLENERDALIFISQNTTIHVPKFLHFSFEGGVASITMEAVHGELMDDLVVTLNEEDQERLTSNVLLYINDTVLPQLRQLRSSTLGSVRGNIIPPYRLKTRARRAHYPSRTSATKDYVYCHNDLAQHNIVVNPETLQVASIIDWEFSGFYPSDFEYPFWLTTRAKRTDWGNEDPAVQRLIKLIDEPGKSKPTTALQPSLALTGFRCKRFSCAPMGGQHDSPARNIFTPLLVACEQGLHCHFESILSIHKSSFLKSIPASVPLIKDVRFLCCLTLAARRNHSHLADVRIECRREYASVGAPEGAGNPVHGGDL